MSNPLVTRDRIDAEVRKALAKALRKDEAEIGMDASVLADLGGTSLDFLDVSFRLEQAFGIKMASRVLLDHVEEAFGEGKAIDAQNRLTKAGAEVLRLRLGEHADLKAGMYSDEVPAFVTPKTLAQGVEDVVSRLPAACGCGASAWKSEDGSHVKCGACGKGAVYPDGDAVTREWLDQVERERHLFAAA